MLKLLMMGGYCLCYGISAVLSRRFGRCKYLLPNGERNGRMAMRLGMALCRTLKIEVDAPQAESLGEGVLFVSNHLGYLDILILQSAVRGRFIAKAEVRKWPVIGRLADLFGCFFCDRDRPFASYRLLPDICESLRQGVNVLLFPEGTTGNGDRKLPFKGMFFEAAVRTGKPVVPLRIEYLSLDGKPIDRKNRDRVYWYGDMTFIEHFWCFLRTCELKVKVSFLPSIDPTGMTRKRLKAMAFESLNRTFAPTT